MVNIVEIFKAHNLTVAIAESMTGGLLSYEFTKNSGSSSVFIGSIVAYDTDVKRKLLKVKKSTIEEHSVVSKQVAFEMVKGLKKSIKADIYVSVTGNAGPGYAKNTNKLNCYICISYHNNMESIYHEFRSDNREENIYETIRIIKNKLLIIV